MDAAGVAASNVPTGVAAPTDPVASGIAKTVEPCAYVPAGTAKTVESKKAVEVATDPLGKAVEV